MIVAEYFFYLRDGSSPHGTCGCQRVQMHPMAVVISGSRRRLQSIVWYYGKHCNDIWHDGIKTRFHRVLKSLILIKDSRITGSYFSCCICCDEILVNTGHPSFTTAKWFALFLKFPSPWGHGYGKCKFGNEECRIQQLAGG